MSEERVDLSMKGATLEHIYVDKNKDEIYFQSADKQWAMWHEQECCESVVIEDISGDINDLLGSPLLVAEEYTNEELEGDWGELVIYTFYRLGTAKGFVDIRWHGESNGYYSVGVEFGELREVLERPYCDEPSLWSELIRKRNINE